MAAFAARAAAGSVKSFSLCKNVIAGKTMIGGDMHFTATGGSPKMFEMVIHLLFPNGQLAREIQRIPLIFLQKLFQLLTYCCHIPSWLPTQDPAPVSGSRPTKNNMRRSPNPSTLFIALVNQEPAAPGGLDGKPVAPLIEGIAGMASYPAKIDTVLLAEEKELLP